MEEAVLCAMMLDSEACRMATEMLSPESFYVEANKAVFTAINELFNTMRAVDLITVVDALKSQKKLEEVGGAKFIARLSSVVASGMNSEYYARVVAQKHLARRIIALAHNALTMAYDAGEDVADTIAYLEAGVTELSISAGGAKTESVEMYTATTNALNKAEQLQAERMAGNATSIPTGISALTREFYGGWKAPDLIVLAGRTSMGKTQLALHFAKSAAEAEKDVLFISIEMSETQLVNRLLLEDERISAYNLSTGQLSEDEWRALNQRASQLLRLKLHIAASPEIKYLDRMCSEARRLKRKGKLSMMVIDYLGLVCTRQRLERRQLEIAHITGTLKSLAKELDIPIILLSQLNRPERGTAVKEPQLHDLRESGDIEQDADIVLFIHRPSYYNEDQYPEWNNKGKIIIGKYREGARNRAVVFHHDNSFKKIWGESYSNSYQPAEEMQGNRSFEKEANYDTGDSPF
jgi:replicative DNA helicase